MDKPFGVLSPGVFQGAVALFEDALGAPVVDIAGGEHGDALLTLKGVIQSQQLNECKVRSSTV